MVDPCVLKSNFLDYRLVPLQLPVTSRQRENVAAIIVVTAPGKGNFIYRSPIVNVGATIEILVLLRLTLP